MRTIKKIILSIIIIIFLTAISEILFRKNIDADDCFAQSETKDFFERDDTYLDWYPEINDQKQKQDEFINQSNSELNPHGEKRLMHQASKTENRIEIIIIADRYRENQQEWFFEKAQKMANHIVASHPINQFKDWVHIEAIGTISPDNWNSIIVNDGTAGTMLGQIKRDYVRPFVNHHFPNITNPNIENNHYWLVLQNGRSGGYASPKGIDEEGLDVTSLSPVIALHELGHLWGLWDEYDSSNMYQHYYNDSNLRSNVNLSDPLGGVLSSENNINAAITSQWGLFIGDKKGPNNQWEGIDGIGIFQMSTQGWENIKWYRPSQRCIMRYSSIEDVFCHVCAVHITRLFSVGRIDDTRIRSYEYAGSDEITITIGSDVRAIGQYSFLKANQLKTLVIESTTPPTFHRHPVTNEITSFFGLDIKNIDVIIPLGTTQYYLDAGWKNFKLIEEEWVTRIKSDNTIEILGINFNPIGHLIIPPIIGGRKVTSIGKSAFAYSGISQITIPQSVTRIGNNAFLQTSLLKVTIPRNVTHIGDYAFSNIMNFNELIFESESNLEEIGRGAFRDNHILKHIEVPSGVRSIGLGAFQGNTGLESISIPFIGSNL